jgi:protein-disulfide isomerase
MINPAHTLLAGILLLAATLAASLATASGSAAAQSRAPAPNPADLQARIAALEQSDAQLRTQLAALKERLEALLGPGADTRVVKMDLGNSPSRGNADAPVVLVLFGDYQSVYSSRAYYVLKRLLEDYPNGLRVVYKHYPLVSLHPQANEAALAAIAAEKQGKFWELHDLLYQNNRRLEPSLYPVLAEQVGLNLSQFDRDRRSAAALERLQEDEAAGAKASITGVPTVFLNGRLMLTWRYDFLKGQIDALRKK